MPNNAEIISIGWLGLIFLFKNLVSIFRILAFFQFVHVRWGYTEAIGGAKGANRNTGKQRENRLDEKQICDMNIYIDEV